MVKWLFFLLPFGLFSQIIPDVVVFPQPTPSIGLISQIAPQNDVLWAVSEGKIYQHNGYQFSSLQPDSVFSNYEALCVWPVDTGLWIGFYTHGVGFYHFKKNQLLWPFAIEKGYPELPDQRVGRIFAVTDTGLWVQSHHFGLAFLALHTPEIKSYPIRKYGAERLRGKNIVSGFIQHPAHKNVRIVLTLGGVFLFDLTTKEYTRFYNLSRENCLNSELCNGNEIGVRTAVVKQNTAWLGTWGGGLIKLDLNTGKFEKLISDPQKLAPKYFEHFRVIHELNDSIFGLVGVNRGLFYFNHKTEKFSSLKNAQGNVLIEKPYSFGRASIGDFYGGRNALYLIPKEELYWKVWPFAKPIYDFTKTTQGALELVYKQDDRVIISANNQAYVVPFSKNHIIDRYNLPDQTKVVVGLRKVLIYNNHTPTELWLPWKDSAGTGAEIVSSYFDQDRATLWLGTKSVGAFGYQINTKKWIALDKGAFPRFWIKDIQKLGNQICFLAEQHLMCYQPKNQRVKKVDFKEIEGLPKGFIPRQLLVSDANTVYFLSSKSGFYRVDLGNKPIATACVPPKNGFVNTFYKAEKINDGFVLATSQGLLFWSETNGARLLGESYRLGAIKQLEWAKDTLWFLHKKSLHYWANPRIADVKKHHPKAEITNFKVMGNAATIDTALTLAHHQNWLEWYAVPSDFLRPQIGEVVVKLVGFSKQWRSISATQAYSISNLKPGKYTLLAKVKTRDNGFGPEQVLMQVNIVPAWFQTWWFYGASLLAILGGLYALYRWRLWQLEQKQAVELKLQRLEMRMLQVQMNPHFIFNALNSVKYYILKENRTVASDYLSRFSKLLRFILSMSKRDKISLHEELAGLTNYIEFERIRFNQKFSYKIDVDESINMYQTEIQPMLIQPFVENAIWHGLMPLEREAELTIKIQAVQDKLCIEIQDNGVGRDASLKQKSKAHKSFGLSITTERLQAMAKKTGKTAQFKIIDLNKNGVPVGTLVKITLPYERINS